LGIYVITAMGYNPTARLMPLVVSIPIFILAVLNMIGDFRKQARKAVSAETHEGKSEASTQPPVASNSHGRELIIFLWVVSAFISFYLLGFVISTFLYTFLSLKVRSRYHWGVSLAVSAGCLAFLYVVMIYGLRVDLYQGKIILMLRKAFFGY
jgi:Tripartite tricarboxylate transporter TctB family